VKPKPGPDHVIVVLPVGHGAAELPDGESEDVVDVDVAVAVRVEAPAELLRALREDLRQLERRAHDGAGQRLGEPPVDVAPDGAAGLGAAERDDPGMDLTTTKT